MKVVLFVSALSSALLAADLAHAADAGRCRPAAGPSATSATACVIVTAEAVRTAQPGSDRSIIIVSGKQSKGQWIGSRASKVTLNPQPLPPRESIDKSR